MIWGGWLIPSQPRVVKAPDFDEKMVHVRRNADRLMEVVDEHLAAGMTRADVRRMMLGAVVGFCFNDGMKPEEIRKLVGETLSFVADHRTMKVVEQMVEGTEAVLTPPTDQT